MLLTSLVKMQQWVLEISVKSDRQIETAKAKIYDYFCLPNNLFLQVILHGELNVAQQENVDRDIKTFQQTCQGQVSVAHAN